MVVVDHMRMSPASALGSPAAREGLDGPASEEQFDSIVEDARLQVVANQPRGDGVEDLAQHEAACGRDLHGCLVIVATAPGRQGLEMGGLDAQGIAMSRIVPTDRPRDEGAVAIGIIEVAGSPQPKRLVEPLFEVSMAAFDGPVLMGDASIVARRLIAAAFASIFLRPRTRGRSEVDRAAVMRERCA